MEEENRLIEQRGSSHNYKKRYTLWICKLEMFSYENYGLRKDVN